MKYLVKGAFYGLLVLMLFSILFIGFGSKNELQGAFTLVDLAPKGFTYNPPDDVSQTAAEKALAQAEKDVQDMKDLNIASLFVQDTLTEVKNTYNSGDYANLFKLTQLIGYVKTEKITFLDKVRLTEIKRQAAVAKGVKNMGDVSQLMQQAMNAFALDQLDEANSLLTQANELLQTANSEFARESFLTAIGRNFFLRYWWQILVVLVMIGISAHPVYKKSRKIFLKNKINHLNLEMVKIRDLIKKLQAECFIEKKITPGTYKDRSAKYEDRIAEIKRTLPVLEAQLKAKNKDIKKGNK
jgi:hypothetical protein